MPSIYCYSFYLLEYQEAFSIRKKIGGHAIQIKIKCSIVGELLEVKSPFWLLPANARRLTYGKNAVLIDQKLHDILLNFRFLLPVLAVPEQLLPGNLEPEDRDIANQLRSKLSEIPYATQKKLRSEITDDWSRGLLQKAWQNASTDFRRKLELIYDLVLLQKMNVYKLVNELKAQSDPIFTHPLILGLSRNNTTFRSFANRWLQDHLDTTMIPELIQSLNGSDEWVKATVIDLLEKLNAKSAIEKVGELLLNDASVKVRSKAAYFLGAIPDESAVTVLLKSIEDDNWIVRQNALEALGKIGAESAVPTLLKYLKNNQSENQSDIIIALGYHPFPKVAESLLPFLDDPALKYVTIAALGKIGDPIALPKIKTIYEKTTREVKKRSIERVIKELEA